jgi:hypothetical protein
MILQEKMLQTPFLKAKKHGPTHLYVIYPMIQSVALVCVEIDKKMPLQQHVHGHHPKTKSHFGSLNYLNFEYVTHACQAKHLSVDCWRSQHPLRANKGPTCQGTSL